MLDVSLLRVRHLHALWKVGLWEKIIGLIWTLYGFFAAWRQELVKPEDQDKLGILKLIPHLSLPFWLFVFALIITIWVFEASFRISTRQNDRISKLELALSPHPSLVIEVTGKRIYIANTGEAHKLGYLANIVNQSGVVQEDVELFWRAWEEKKEHSYVDHQEYYFPACEPFTLRRGESRSVPFVMFSIDEPGSPAEPCTQWINKWGIKTAQPILRKGDYQMQLRVLSKSAAPAFLRLRFWCDGEFWKVSDVLSTS